MPEKSRAFDSRFAEELGRTAANDELDPAFRALALTLPSEVDVAQALVHDVDPDAVHEAHRALQAEIGRQIGDVVAEAAARAAPSVNYSPNADQAGRRALTHASWALRAAAGELPGAELGGMFAAAENLTDRLAALRLLVHFGLDGADDALDAFARRYATSALVLDKWFAVQSTAPVHSALERVETLSAHPGFSLKNPNRVYALIRSYAAANPVGFNRPDGAGYRYLARIIGELDPQNPSVAARLATTFRSYRMLEPNRRGHAEAALRQINGFDNLSKDVSDIVARTLEG